MRKRAVTAVKKSLATITWAVVAKEGRPVLSQILSRTTAAVHVFPHRARSNANPELHFQFVGDPLFPPGDVLRGHRADELLEFLGKSRSPDGPGFPAAEQTELLAVPPDECVRPDHHEGVAPFEPETP